MKHRKDLFIEATKEYIEKVEPLLEINKKTNLGNIRFCMYKIMIMQGWYKGKVKIDEHGITHP